jgi:hypothetical protein
MTHHGSPVVAICGECGSRCTLTWMPFRRLWLTWVVRFSVGAVVWILFGLTLPASAPGWFLAACAFVVGFCTAMATNRIYHALWMHRHPMRCQGGGEPEPARSAA